MQAKMGFAIIVTAAVLIVLVGAIQYYFSYSALNKGLKTDAEKDLMLVNARIINYLDVVEKAVDCMALSIEEHLNAPDSLNHYMGQLLTVCPNIVNCAIAFVPDYYPAHGRWFEPLVTRNHDGSYTFIQAGGEDHDYFEMPFYKIPMANDSDYWSEPYMNVAGRETMVASYSRAIHGQDGQPVGVICADIPLDWLSKLANRRQLFASSYIMMLSREGRLLVYPVDKSKVINKRVSEIHDNRHSSVDEMNRRMMAGERGEMEVLTPKGEKRLAFFAPVFGDVGWSVAVICDKEEVYENLNTLQWYVLGLMLLTVLLLGFILWRSARSQLKLQAAQAEGQRMASELSIARGIQQGMLPAHSLVASRDDVDLCGCLIPAREVGGDLYDYLIRDEKLFFCIGDVSGKGVPASLMMAVTRTLFRTHASHATSPRQILQSINNIMMGMNNESLFVTLFLGVLDLPTGHLRYCNAGHDAPLLINPLTHEVEVLDVLPNLPLGVLNDFDYVGQECHIASPAMLFLYTDGLTEARDMKDQMFRESRIMEVAKQGSFKSPQQLVDRMTEAVKSFVGGASQSDDLTMLSISLAAANRTERLRQSLTVSNDIAEVPRLHAFTDDVNNQLGLDAALSMQITLAIEEAVVNVMNYAYPKGTRGEIVINAVADTSHLRYTITDSGAAFDPTNREQVDISLSAEDRPIGGLGIHLVRHCMDSINYERIADKNVLTLLKKIK